MPATTSVRHRGRRGVTLVELMITVTVLVLIFASVTPMFQLQARSLARHAGRADAIQTARFTLATLDRELRIAGPPNEVEEQPLLVQADPYAVTFNVDLATRDSASASAVYFDPDVNVAMTQALTPARAVTLPRSAATFPSVEYRNPAGVGSDAETISFWVQPDAAASHDDEYELWRRVNDDEPVIVARGLVVRPGRPFFTYYAAAPGDSLAPIAGDRLPALHLPGDHGDAADVGAVALVDSVRMVRVVAEVRYHDPRSGDTTYVSDMNIKLLNAGLIRRSTCGTAPIGVALSAMANPGGTVSLTWSASIDELGGERDVERYVVFRRLLGASDWGEPFHGMLARGGPYSMDDVEAKSVGSAWEYSIMAQDCTPMNSDRQQAAAVTILP